MRAFRLPNLVACAQLHRALGLPILVDGEIVVQLGHRNSAVLGRQ